MGPRRLPGDRLLATDGKDQAGIPGRVVRVRGHGAARRRWIFHVLWPRRRPAQGGGQVAGPAGSRKLSVAAPCREGGGGSRRRGRARSRQTACVRRRPGAPRRTRRGAPGVRTGPARALQVPARGDFSRRAAAHASGQGGSRATASSGHLALGLRRPGPLLELSDELLDLELQALERGKELGLEVALQLLALLEKVLHQVAKPLRQLPPGGYTVDLRGLAWLALLR